MGRWPSRKLCALSWEGWNGSPKGEKAEGWPSGRRQRFAKPSQGQKLCRGFKSRPLRHLYQDQQSAGSFRPASFPECINASPRSHEKPRESQPIEKSDKEDERKDEHGRLVVTPTVILAQARKDNAQDGSQHRVLRRPPCGVFFGPQTRLADLTVLSTLGTVLHDPLTIR